MSHELRTLLTSIIGFTKLTLVDTALSETSRRWISKVDSASQKLLNVVNDVLDLAKLEAGQVSVRPQPVRLATLAQFMDLFNSKIADKKLGFRVIISDPSTHVLVEADRVGQIPADLVANAIKLTDRGEIIWR